MKNKFDEECELLLLKEEHIKILYDWNKEEKQFENYTCRPVKLSKSFEEYSSKILSSISEGKQKHYALIKKDNIHIPLGKITLFDFNPRNHSAEFGYYFPKENRGQGLGRIILNEFIKLCFEEDNLNLNKIYATTASNNSVSIKLLENFNFKLDGRLREHYFIGENKYDQLIYSMLKSEY